MPDTHYSHTLRHTAELLESLRNGQEVAIIDLREEADYATGHPLYAVNLPLSKLEIEVLDRIPRRATAITLYDNGTRYNQQKDTRLVDVASQRLKALGYVNVAVLAGDLAGWKEAGGEIFIDVNVPSKAFGKWARHSAGGTQSLSNAPIANPPLSHESRLAAADNARQLARRAGVKNISLSQLNELQADGERTLYLFDVRTLAEYQQGHFPDSRHAQDEQLVQETDRYAIVRGARIVLIDDDGVRANIAAAWLAQMNWEVYVLAGDAEQQGAAAWFSEQGNGSINSAPVPAIEHVDGEQLQKWIAEGETGIIDLTLSANFRNRRIPGAVFTSRSQLPQILAQRPAYKRWVVTCGSGFLARYAVTEVTELTGSPAYLLEGGTLKWIDEKRPLEHGDSPYLQNPRDKYLRPYEGTQVSAEAVQAYIDWESGLVEQLARDNTHGFRLLDKA